MKLKTVNKGEGRESRVSEGKEEKRREERGERREERGERRQETGDRKEEREGKQLRNS